MSLFARWTEASPADRPLYLGASAAATLLIAFADYSVKPNISLGYLYILPILVAAGFLSRPAIVAFAVVCAVLRERLGPFPYDELFWTREALVFAAFASSGLLAREIVDGRRRSEAYSRDLEAQIELRRDAEEQLRVLVESNPAAIFTADADRRILSANGAAARLTGYAKDELAGRLLEEILPDFARVPVRSERRFFRTSMECTGRRRDGSLLAAEAWFSTYRTTTGDRLAAIVLDLTEEIRSREGIGLDAMLTTSRVVAGALLHEIRNLSAAASVAHANLARDQRLAENEDFRSLGTLVAGLERTASNELGMIADRSAARVDLTAVLAEFQLLVAPAVEEMDAELHIEAPAERVRIDRHSLIQVLLNLERNSRRALEKVRTRSIRLSCNVEKDAVLLRFEDAGPGVEDPAVLFQPFRGSADTTGLGLYVSRAIVRSFGGELYHEATPVGACFVIRLRRVAVAEEQAHEPTGEHDQGSADRRPHAVSAGVDPAAGS